MLFPIFPSSLQLSLRMATRCFFGYWMRHILKIAFFNATWLTVSLAQEAISPTQDTLPKLDTVTISAYQWQGKRWESPGSYGLLRGPELTPADNNSLATVLNTLPGVSMQSGTYATNRIVIRGMGSRTPFNTNRIRSFLNDIPLSGADGISAPEEIDTEALGSIELIKGPGAALYGSGLGGSLHMHTPPSNGNQFGFGVQYGSFETLRLHGYGAWEQKHFKIWSALNFLSSEGFRENNHYARGTSLTHARWLGKRWSLGATLLLMQVDAGIPSSVGETLLRTNPCAAAPNWLAVEGYKKYSRGLAGLQWVQQISDHWTNHLLFYGRLTDNFERRPFNNLDDQVSSYGWRQRLQYRRGAVEWMLGSEWFSEAYRWNLDRNGSILADNQERRGQLTVFTLVYWKLNKRLLLSGGLAYNRVEYQLRDLIMQTGANPSQRRFPDMWSPRMGVNYALTKNFVFYGSAGHGFSMPSPEETLLPDGAVNPGIRAEQGIQSEIGLRWKTWHERIKIDLCAYRIDLNDLLVTKRITEDIFTGINAGKTRHSGLELAAGIQVLQRSKFPGALHVRNSYTCSVNRFVDFEDDGRVFDGNNLPGIPAQMVQSVWTWRPVSAAELMMHYQFTGAQYINDANTVQYGAFQTLNLRASWHINRGKRVSFSWYGGINNATNTQYASMLVVNALAIGNNEPRYYYPALPLHGYCGIRVMWN